MKSSLWLAMMLVSAMPLAACESSSTARNSDASDYRQVSVSNNGMQQTYNVPANNASSGDTPYAIRGSNQTANSNYNNVTGTPRQGTNGW
jgi:hypothetical protein